MDPAARRELALAQVALRLRAVHGRIAAALCGEGAVDGVPGAVRVGAVKTKHLDEAVAYAEEAMAEGRWLASYAERCRRAGAAPPTWALTKSIVAAARSVLRTPEVQAGAPWQLEDFKHQGLQRGTSVEWV